MTPDSERATTVTTTLVLAECHRCQWRSDAVNAHGNAARHHDASGHPVTVTVTRRIVYGDPGAAPPGQEELFT